MKFVDEYQNPESIERCSREIAQITTQSWTIMEVCGGQTHTIMKYGLDQLLPDKITLLHGPGCPVCVTPISVIDKALEISSQKDLIICSFGDMLRVPGSSSDLLSIKALGGDVRMVYSPLDALKIAQDNPQKEVVFFGIGFETTAPATAITIHQAKCMALSNFSVLMAQVLVPPAIEAILSSPQNKVQAFLAAGHVCTVMGFTEYERLAASYSVPIVVTGFEPLDILQGICMAVGQLEQHRTEVENQYARSVSREGNREAQRIMQEVFTTVDRKWRGFGEIPKSGLGLSETYREFDAEHKFGAVKESIAESTECMSGLILQGLKKPPDCPLFGARCTPENPLGATMVSAEGTCNAYYRYRSRDRQISKK